MRERERGVERVRERERERERGRERERERGREREREKINRDLFLINKPFMHKLYGIPFMYIPMNVMHDIPFMIRCGVHEQVT